MYINTQTLKTYASHSDVRSDFPLTSLPSILTDEMLEELGIYSVKQTVPTYNPVTEVVRELAPALTDKGHWEQRWEVVASDTEQIEANQAAKAVADAKLINDKIEALWAATDRYTSGYISGVAIGILTIGVMQQKPKALAVTEWSSTIWAEYYARKELITATSTVDHDFTAFGAIPFSVPELQKEVGL